MLAFTDGLLEATSREGGPFGTQRVEAVVAREMDRTAAEIIRCMHESLTAFAGSTSLNDDVTMVVLKVDKASSGVLAPPPLSCLHDGTVQQSS